MPFLPALEQRHQSFRGSGIHASQTGLAQKKTQVLAQKPGTEIGVAVIVRQHPLELFVHRRCVQRRRTQHIHEAVDLEAGRLNQSQGQRIAVGEAGDQLVESQF